MDEKMHILIAAIVLMPFYLSLDTALSQTLAEEAQSLLSSLGEAKEKMRVAQDTKKALEKERQEHLDTDKRIKKAFDDGQKELHDTQREYEQYKSEWDKVRGRGCIPGTTSTDIPFVNACNAEIAKLNAWDARLASRAEAVKLTAEITVKERDALNNKVLTWAQSVKANNAELDDLGAQIQNIQVRLKEVQKMVTVCNNLQRKIHPRVKDEELKLKCGNVQFDNADPNLPPLNK